MRYFPSFRAVFRCINFAAVISAWTGVAYGAAGTETFVYDARGRLIQVTYPSGAVQMYSYDAAGNRITSGAATPPPAAGTFAFISGSHSRGGGSSGDVVTATVKNTGSGAITGISYTCTGGSWYKMGSPPASLAAGATGTFQCTSAASGSYTVVFSFSGVGATNSPFTTSAW